MGTLISKKSILCRVKMAVNVVNSDCEREVESKKRKLIVGDSEENDGASYCQSRFNGLQVVKVLNENARSKSLFLQGTLADKNAVVLLEKTAFNAETISDFISEKSRFIETLNNDIYSTFEVHSNPQLNPVKATLIYPATSKHIEKYTDQDAHVIQETAALYREVTLPYLVKQKFSIQWVYNILDHVTESDRIVEEDESLETGFVLLPDMKWDRKDVTCLYLVAIAHCKDIKSLRDLGKQHLPLLRNIFNRGCKAIKEKFGVAKSKLRVYIHYQPSYYHFHVHFTHVKLEAPGFEADRAHLMLDVIENIEVNAEFYQQKTLVFKVRENDGLYNQYKEAGYFDAD